MSQQRQPKKLANIPFTRDELQLLSNALNEVCHGVNLGDEEFQTRLGCKRELAQALLARMHALLGKHR
jgi:hypothetical protein